MEKAIWTVKEWIFNKIYEEAKNYNIYLIGEEDERGMTDRTKLRVEEVLQETEKAYKVSLDAETMNGVVKTWKTWIPKSQIISK